MNFGSCTPVEEAYLHLFIICCVSFIFLVILSTIYCGDSNGTSLGSSPTDRTLSESLYSLSLLTFGERFLTLLDEIEPFEELFPNFSRTFSYEINLNSSIGGSGEDSLGI